MTTKGIISKSTTKEDEYIINVENLLGEKLEIGNGKDEQSDVYKLIEVTEVAKIASLEPIKMETVQNKKYKVVYCGETEEEVVELGFLNDRQVDNKIESGENKAQWIYEENSSGNIEITGIDLSECLYQYNDSRWTYYGAKITLGFETLNVPLTINGKKVTKVSLSEIVSPCEGNLEIIDVKKIIFSNQIEEISGTSDLCFSAVEEIVLPESIKTIGNYAFYNCSSLKNIIIPNGVTSIGNYAFCDCSSLASIIIPDGVIQIGEGAFSSCSSLTSITIPRRVTSIKYSTFSNCIGLTSITIQEGVTSIDYWAFFGCRNLKSVNIPQTVTGIDTAAFYMCEDFILNFNNGKNSALEIPDDKWGANSILINGVEYIP